MAQLVHNYEGPNNRPIRGRNIPPYKCMYVHAYQPLVLLPGWSVSLWACGSGTRKGFCRSWRGPPVAEWTDLSSDDVNSSWEWFVGAFGAVRIPRWELPASPSVDVVAVASLALPVPVGRYRRRTRIIWQHLRNGHHPSPLKHPSSHVPLTQNHSMPTRVEQSAH